MNPEEIASKIDHTLLKPDTTFKQIETLCDEALKNCFASVCINPFYVSTAYEILKKSNTVVCTVIGFPLGASPSEVKAFEAEKAIADGASEIDMVMNIGAAKSGRWDIVQSDIASVVKTAHSQKAIVKVIFENCLLNANEIREACSASVKAEADFVKTSTGFSASGATIEDVKLMAEAVSGKAKVKAAGGVRNYEQAVAMFKAGADRLGTSGGIAIINGKTNKEY